MTSAIIWYAFDAVLVINFAVYIIGSIGKHNELRGIVFFALDSAARNGYFQPGEQLHGMPAEEVARDMQCYSEGCGGYYPYELVPYVREWIRKRGAGEWHT